MPRPRTVPDADILAVARTLFLRDGAGASTRDIAKTAGVSEAVLFQRFGTKERLFFAAMVPPPARLGEMFDAAPGSGEVPANVERLLLRLLDYFREVMPVFVTLVSHPAFDLAAFLKGHEIPAAQVGGRLSDYLAAEARLGRVRTDRASTAAGLLVNALHNYALMECVGAYDRSHAPHAVAGAVAALWDGLKPDAGSSSSKRRA